MMRYIITRKGRRVHIMTRMRHTLCGLKSDGYNMRHATKDDKGLPTCRTCEQIIIGIVNA